MLTEKGKGIKSVVELPTIEINRKEVTDDKNNRVISFEWLNSKLEYSIWQVCHFRLLGDDRLLPYGTSVFSPVRSYFRMLRMQEDAMLVYRASRASERRVIKVNVGNADVNDVPMLVPYHAWCSEDKELNYKFNPATVDQDIFIAVRTDNATSPIETLPGAQNLNDIEDTKYFRENLFAGIGIPASFLGFSGDDGGSAGGGRNLSGLDVRFARRVNRIQQNQLSHQNFWYLLHVQ